MRTKRSVHYLQDLFSLSDSHDAVLRFNAAPTEGYERDVGSKTTIRIINSQVSGSPALRGAEYWIIDARTTRRAVSLTQTHVKQMLEI